MAVIGFLRLHHNSERGVARTKKGDLNGAIADFAKVIELKPDNAEAYDNRAQDRF
jgi:Flp pilus assembly protein TadD